jgi:site-specific recombinase XerC
VEAKSQKLLKSKTQMINRKNKKLVDEYLKYRLQIDQLEEESIRLEKNWLKHCLTWSDETEFRNAPKLPELFREYVIRQTKISGEPLSQNYKRKIIEAAKHLFLWASIHKTGYRSITPAWLNTFKHKKTPTRPNEIKSISEEKITFLAKLPVKTLSEQRIRAGVCFLYLSGMRINAFTSLPIKAVNIKELEVQQFPSLGVRTKNNKTAITHVLHITEIFDIICDWDAYIRPLLPPTGFWFAPLSPKTGELDLNKKTVGKNRSTIFRKNLSAWLQKNETKHHTPHDFRRGHANYLFDYAEDIGDLIAAQENLMHESLTTTEIYARQRKAQTKQRIQNMGMRKKQGNLSFPTRGKKDEGFDELRQEVRDLTQLLRSKNEK